jgi:hypothetical protein
MDRVANRRNHDGEEGGEARSGSGAEAGGVQRRSPSRSGSLPRVQDHPEARALHFCPDPARFRQARPSCGGRVGCGVLHRTPGRPEATDQRSGLPGHGKLQALQQRVHLAAAHHLPGRLSGGRSGDRLQVPPPGPAEGRGAGRAAAHPRRLPDQVQGRGAAAAREDWRVPAPVLSQCGVRPEPGERRGPRVPGHPGAPVPLLDAPEESRSRKG